MLYLRELKKAVFSVAFVIFVLAMLAMAVGQETLNFKDKKIEMPQPGQNYGTQTKEIPEIIMPAALNSLYSEFCINSYTAYPIGFYKSVKLNDRKSRQMADILSVLTGIPADELIRVGDGTAAPQESQGKTLTMGAEDGITLKGNGSFEITASEKQSGPQPGSSVALKEGISYEEFKGYMAEADGLIGGGSDYSTSSIIKFGKVALTYEEAMEQYQLSKNTDRFTGAYARLFSDYIGVGVLSVLPVFLAVALCLKDKRSKMDELIYIRQSSSIRIIMIRYLAIITAVMLPTILLSYISNISVWGLFDGMALDYLAPLKYAMGWLLPSVMISAAVGMLFTELTDTAVAIAIQGLWWFVDVNMGIREINGGYPLLRLAPRHNTLKYTQVFIDRFDSLAANRLLFAGLSLLLIAATVVIYEQKRRGKLNGTGKIKKLFAKLAGLANRKNKSAA